MVDVEPTDDIQRGYPLVNVGRHEPGLALREDGISGEDDTLLRDIDRHLTGGMARGVDQWEGVLADAQIQVPAEHQLALRGIRVVLGPLREQGRAVRIVCRYGL